MEMTKPRYNIKDNVPYDEQPQENQTPAYVTDQGEIVLTHPDHSAIFKPQIKDLGSIYSESPP